MKKAKPEKQGPANLQKLQTFYIVKDVATGQVNEKKVVAVEGFITNLWAFVVNTSRNGNKTSSLLKRSQVFKTRKAAAASMTTVSGWAWHDDDLVRCGVRKEGDGLLVSVRLSNVWIARYAYLTKSDAYKDRLVDLKAKQRTLLAELKGLDKRIVFFVRKEQRALEAEKGAKAKPGKRPKKKAAKKRV